MRFNNQEIQTIIKNSRKDQPINNMEDLKQVLVTIADYFIRKTSSDSPISKHKLNFLDNDSFALNKQLSMFVTAAFSDILNDAVNYGHELEKYLCVLKDRTGNEESVTEIKNQIVALFAEHDRGITVTGNDRKFVDGIINQVRPIRSGEDLEEIMKSLTQEYVNRTSYFVSQANKKIVNKSREWFNRGCISPGERVKNCVNHICCIKTGETNSLKSGGDLYRLLHSVRAKIADDSEVSFLKECFDEALDIETNDNAQQSSVRLATSGSGFVNRFTEDNTTACEEGVPISQSPGANK